jgi:hypothetical protein
MRTPNTTFDVYLSGTLPPATPDASGLMGHLEDDWHGSADSHDFAWTAIIEVALGTNLPELYPGSLSQTTLWVPDQNGEAYTVVFVERERAFRGDDFLRVYLAKGYIVAITIKEQDGSPSYGGITTLIVDQADGLSLSQPAANQARLDLLTQMSITADASGLKLSGDSSSPGNDKYYGTNGSGTKGWYDLPTGGGDDPGLARGWVKFSAAGSLSVLDSHNVDSVTDNGTGDFTVNWDTDFASSNYAWTFAFENSGDSTDVWHVASNGNTAESASSLSLRTYDESLTLADTPRVCVIAFGDQS